MRAFLHSAVVYGPDEALPSLIASGRIVTAHSAKPPRAEDRADLVAFEASITRVRAEAPGAPAPITPAPLETTAAIAKTATAPQNRLFFIAPPCSGCPSTLAMVNHPERGSRPRLATESLDGR